MSAEVTVWWSALCMVTVINIVAWCVSALLLKKHHARWPRDALVTRQRLLWLSAVYVLGCGFRSVLPMLEAPRICLHDIWISRAVFTRSVATVAELCFAMQWALLLREAGAAAESRCAALVSKWLIPIVIAAQLFCWGAVLTENYLLHAIENSLWTFAALLALPALAALWPRVGNVGRRFLAVAIGGNVGYIAFMVLVDVPMYLSRWHVAGAGRPFDEGLQLLVQRCIVRTDWAAWREDAVWLTLYFTIAVWASIALAHAPPFRRAVRPET